MIKQACRSGIIPKQLLSRGMLSKEHNKYSYSTEKLRGIHTNRPDDQDWEEYLRILGRKL